MGENATYGGFVKLYRSFLDWEWYGDTNCVRLAVHFLLKVNYQPKRWHGVVIERGQMMVSRAKLSDETGLTEMQIRTALAKLTASGFISKLSTKTHTMVTICNYDLYQPLMSVDNQVDNQQTTSGQPTEQPTNNQPSNQGNNQHNSQEEIFARRELSECYGALSAADNQRDNQHDNRRSSRNITNDITTTKENKKERKEEYTHTPVYSEKGVVGGKDATAMLDWIADHFPEVGRMTEPFDGAQMSQLLSKYEAADIKRIVAAMDNKGAFKNKNAFSTFSIYARYDDVLKDRRKSAAEQGRLYTYEEMCNEIPVRAKGEDFERVKVGGRNMWRKKIIQSQ